MPKLEDFSFVLLSQLINLFDALTKERNPERFTLLNRVPFGKFNKVNPEPVSAY